MRVAERRRRRWRKRCRWVHVGVLLGEDIRALPNALPEDETFLEMERLESCTSFLILKTVNVSINMKRRNYRWPLMLLEFGMALGVSTTSKGRHSIVFHAGFKHVILD